MITLRLSSFKFLTYKNKYFTNTLYVTINKKHVKPLIIKTLFEIKGTFPIDVAIALTTKNKPLPISTANKILIESWALVYLIIPAYVFKTRNTITLAVAIIKAFRLNSM